MSKAILMVGAFAVLAAGPVSAQMRGAPKVGQTKVQAAAVAARAFKALDQNGDGSFDQAEATTALQARATKNGREFRPRMASRTVARNDGDGNGKVTLAEFTAAAATRFDAADTNKNGVIDAAETAGAPAPAGDAAPSDE